MTSTFALLVVAVAWHTLEGLMLIEVRLDLIPSVSTGLPMEGLIGVSWNKKQRFVSYVFNSKTLDVAIFRESLKDTIPIYFSAKRTRFGTIMKNHIWSSSSFLQTALSLSNKNVILHLRIITQYGNTVYKKFKFAQKNKPDKAFGDFRCQTSEVFFMKMER